MKKIISVCKATFAHYKDSDMGVYAGYATLFIITAIFPLLMLMISVVNMLPGYSPSDLTDFLFQFLPDLSSVKALVLTMVSNLKAQSSGLLASVSALTTLWSASAGVSALQKGLKKLSRDSGSKLPDKIIALLFTLVFIVLVPAVVIFQMLGTSIIELVHTVSAFFGVDNITDRVASLIQVSSIITVVAMVLIILLAYALLPGKSGRVGQKLPGTAFTAFLCFAFTQLFSYFIPRFYHSSGLYGSLASLFLILMWLRIILTIFFLGASLNRAIDEIKNPVPEKETVSLEAAESPKEKDNTALIIGLSHAVWMAGAFALGGIVLHEPGKKRPRLKKQKK